MPNLPCGSALPFERADAHVVAFPNPLTGAESAKTVHLAVRPRR